MNRNATLALATAAALATTLSPTTNAEPVTRVIRRPRGMGPSLVLPTVDRPWSGGRTNRSRKSSRLRSASRSIRRASKRANRSPR